eukprot:853426_1
MSHTKKQIKMNQDKHQQIISTQGLLDLVLFFSLFWMILFHNAHGRGGKWRPNVMYLPVLLLRWVFVPHRDWMKEHFHHYSDQFRPVHHHDHNHHHHHHHHQHHNENKKHQQLHRDDSSFGNDNIGISLLNEFYGQ